MSTKAEPRSEFDIGPAGELLRTSTRRSLAQPVSLAPVASSSPREVVATRPSTKPEDAIPDLTLSARR
jgi:hypothetical protein